MINLREKNFKLFKVAISTVFNNIKQTMIQVNFKKKKKKSHQRNRNYKEEPI